ncbi:MAG: prephenate dehydrogenase [Gammaproteobacteria bacterium]
MIERLCIIGVGLIGGSLALALRRAGYVKHVVGTSRNEANLRKAVELGVIDDYTLEPARAVAHADVVVLAVPLGAVRTVCESIKDAMPRGAILSDAGSAKGCVVNDVHAAFGSSLADFVPAHPIAGIEKNGVEAAFAELFDKRLTILTPLDSTSPTATDRITAMWEAAGSRVTVMEVAHHDQVLAATSHLPHVLAYGLVDSLARMEDVDEIFQYAAGGFRDFTRIASSDPVMWRDVCLANRAAVSQMIERYQTDLETLARAIAAADGDTLLNIFQHAKQTRDQFCG